VSTQVYESDNFVRVFDDLSPVLVLIGFRVFHDDLIIFVVKSHDLRANARCPAGFNLLLKVEYSLAY